MKEHNNDCVSVIIPCYNHEKYIEATINSILNQTHENIEILVGDDCSTDGTRKILKKIRDPRVKVFYYEQNKGTVLSMNYLLKKASGKFVCMLGSDDAFEPEKIERQLNTFRKKPFLGAVFTDVRIVDEAGLVVDDDTDISKIFKESNRTQAQWIRYFFETGNHLCHPSVMIPKTVIEDIGLFHSELRQLHDFDYWLRLLIKYQIEIIPEQLTIYRREIKSKNSVSASLPKNEMRLRNEYALIFYRLFENISQSLFEEAFSDIIHCKTPMDDKQFLIERFHVLQTLMIGEDRTLGSAALFFAEKIAPLLSAGEELPYGKDALSQFYELSGNLLVGNNLLRRRDETIEQLKRELDCVYGTKGWKMLEKMRAAKRAVLSLKHQ